MKKIVTSLVAIAVVAAVAAVGSYAVWVDTEDSNDNTITADQMDLVLTNVPVSIGNVYPGQTGIAVPGIELLNDSNTVDGNLTMTIDPAIVNWENDCPEAESVEGADATCGDPGLGEGELQDYLTVGVTLDTDPATDSDSDGDSTNDADVVISAPDTLANLAAAPLDLGTLPAGATYYANVTFEVASDPTYPAVPNVNEFMTDSVVFDATFTLTQI